MKAFDFAFGPMEEYLDSMDDARTLTLKGKPLGAHSFRRRKSQLRLIEGCYNGKTGVVSELLRSVLQMRLVLFHIQEGRHHPHVSSWALRPLLEARALGVAVAQLNDAIWTVGDFSGSGNVIARRRRIILSFFFVHCNACFLCESPDGRFGDMRPGMGSCGSLAANVTGAYLGRSCGDAA